MRFSVRIRSVVALVVALFVLVALLQPGTRASADLIADSGFESGGLTGWVTSGNVSVSGGETTSPGGGFTWAVSPAGTKMGRIEAGAVQYNAAISALGLSDAQKTQIQNVLNAQQSGSTNPTTAAWATRQVSLTAGVTYTMAWNYLSVDYVPFNDGSLTTLVYESGAASTPTITVNNSVGNFALLGFTNPGTGDYSTGSYGSTGWQVSTYQVSQSGTYKLGFTTFNLGDTSLSPILYIDDSIGSITKNGAPFGAVAPNNSNAPTVPTTSAVSAPGAPTITGITRTGTNGSVAFTAPASNGGAAIEDYEVRVGVQGGAVGSFVSAGSTTSPLSISGLNPGNVYEVTIRAKNSEGVGLVSNVVTGRTPPGAPTITSVVRSGTTGVVLFTPPTGDGGRTITDYQVRVSVQGSALGSFISAGVTTSALSVGGLNAGGVYELAIRAVNAEGEGATSNTVAVKTPPGPPTLNFFTAVNGQVFVKFAPPTGNGGEVVTHYEVSLSESGQAGSWSLASVANESVSFPNVRRSVPYSVQLRAVNSEGVGPASQTLSFEIPPDRVGARPETIITQVPTSAVPTSAAQSTAPSSSSPESSVAGSSSTPLATRPTVPGSSTPAVPVTQVPGSLPSVPLGQSVVTENGASVPVSIEQKGAATWQMKGPGFDWQLEIPGAGAAGSSQGVVTLVRDREVEVSGNGFRAGSIVDVWLFSTPVFLGTVVVGPDGSFEGSLKVPPGMPVGSHTIQANGLTPDQQVRSLNLGVQVVGSPRLPVTGGQVSGLFSWALTLIVSGVVVVGLNRRRRGA